MGPRLTDEELESFDLRDQLDDAYGVSGEQLRPVADAQFRKALWWAHDWLEQFMLDLVDEGVEPVRRWASSQARYRFYKQLTELGIKPWSTVEDALPAPQDAE